jgi:type VI secretion system secreted protein Hcp
MFLKLDGIKGESLDHKHAGEIHIESWSWGMSQTGAHGAGRAAAAPAKFPSTTSTLRSSWTNLPALMLHCCSGKHIPNGLVTVRAEDKRSSISR